MVHTRLKIFELLQSRLELRRAVAKGREPLSYDVVPKHAHNDATPVVHRYRDFDLEQ